MTLPPEKIGDKGQRFQIKYSRHMNAMDDEHTLGYADTQEGADQMANIWRKHPEAYFVWTVDRHATVVNEAAPKPRPRWLATSQPVKVGPRSTPATAPG